MEKVILHLDMNAFFAAVEQKANPSLRGKPVLVGGKPNTRTVVAAASYEAKARGVKSGMSLAEALRLCPGAVVVEGTPMKYIHTSTQIFNMMKDYTPYIEIFSIDEAFADITETHRFFGGPEQVAVMIKQRIKQKFGLTCSIGIAPGRVMAKLASGMQKPDGLVRIRKEEVPRVLEGLPVEELCGIGEKMKMHLFNMGIVTCGDLARAPLSRLTEKFGVTGRVLSNMGKGLDEGIINPYDTDQEARSMGHMRTLNSDTYDITVVKANLLSLSEMVGRRLRRDGYAGRTVCLTLRYGDFSLFSKQLTVTEPLDDGYHIYRAALRILDTVNLLHRPVRLTGVSVSNLVKGAKQLWFLHDVLRQQELTGAMDKINDKFGEFSITRAAVLMNNASAEQTPTHGFLHHR